MFSSYNANTPSHIRFSKLRFYVGFMLGRQNHAPGSLFMCSSSHKGIDMLEKSLHTLGAQRLKSVHTVLKMCTPGAGCTLNFIQSVMQTWTTPIFNVFG